MSALLDYIKKNGRAPQVSLNINPLNDTTAAPRQQIQLSNFLAYQFSDTILIPVSAFSFTFAMPSTTGAINKYIQEGDNVELIAGGVTVATGTIDVVDIETTKDGGDVVSIMGRNLLGSLEDNSPVNSKQQTMWGNNIPLATAVGSVIQGTKIRGLITQQAPGGNFLFGTSPGESKLSSLLRFVEPLNCMVWGHPAGYMIVGRPNMGQSPLGDIICDRDKRFSNVESIKAIRASTQIPNIYIPVWQGQESIQSRVAAEQAIYNAAEGPKGLRLKGYQTQKCIVVSTPQGSDPQSLSDVNAIKVANSNLLQAYALREMAKANITELVVQANVKSHYNDDLIPFMIDQVYNVNYPRAGVQEKMYLYQVDYSCDAESGPRTSLNYCRLGCIVAGASKGAATQSMTNSGSLATL